MDLQYQACNILQNQEGQSNVHGEREMLTRLFGLEVGTTVIHCDNIFKNLVFHDMSKHIEIIYHFIRDSVKRGVAILQYISTEE